MFSFLSALMKVHRIPHGSCETTRSRFIQILYHCSVSWRIPPVYFFISNLYTVEKKEPIENKLSDFWVFGWKFTNFLMSYLKLQGSFSLNFESLFSVMRDLDMRDLIHDLDKRSLAKCKISEFGLLT